MCRDRFLYKASCQLLPPKIAARGVLGHHSVITAKDARAFGPLPTPFLAAEKDEEERAVCEGWRSMVKV